MLLEQKEGGFWSTGAPRLETFSKQSRTRRGAAQQELYIHRSSTRLPIGNTWLQKCTPVNAGGGVLPPMTQTSVVYLSTSAAISLEVGNMKKVVQSLRCCVLGSKYVIKFSVGGCSSDRRRVRGPAGKPRVEE